jgi:lipopolysaccharide/colanic/teichoic acid biosynthesis glycosyltransferase
MIKRMFDLLLALVGLISVSLFLVVIALWIKLDSPGPVFYRGLRVGRAGKVFRIFKFRSMVMDAERIGASSTPDDDPRVTRAGRLLRKYKLDELPQLFNVLNGTMSMVGPRPQVGWMVELYSPDERAILSLRPGITDYSSLKFRNEGEILRGSADPDRAYLEKIHPEKMKLSLQYLQDNSLWLDCKILMQTLAVLFVRSAAMKPSTPREYRSN